jgi:hypothetical protein
MNTCTSCTRKLPAEAFVHNGKVFKTCSSCLSKRREKAKRTASSAEGQTETSLETIDFYEVSDYVADKISCCAKLAIDLNIRLDDETLTSVSHDVKSLVKLVADTIEDGDGYSWV